MRYFLELSYCGSLYHGWQRQPNALSVQQIIEEALTTLLGKETAIVGAGRTDTGVHAKQLFAHFNTDISVEKSDELTYKLNRFLPKDIAIIAIHPVTTDAHARFDAISRSYEYHISEIKDPFTSGLVYHFNQPLDIDVMNDAAKKLLCHRDFKCFSRSKTDVKTYACEVTEAYWEYHNNQWTFYISANRFLRNMVRAIVGTLLDVGTGRITLAEFQSILNSQDRTKAGSSAPAQGLFLTRVQYPNTIFVARGKEYNK